MGSLVLASVTGTGRAGTDFFTGVGLAGKVARVDQGCLAHEL